MAQFMREMSQAEIATLTTEDVVAVLAVHESGAAARDYVLYVVNNLMPQVDIAKCTFEVLAGSPRDSSPAVDWLDEKRLLKTLFYGTTVSVNAGEGVVRVTIVVTKLPGQKTVLELT
jgi:hypothetical protein